MSFDSTSAGRLNDRPVVMLNYHPGSSFAPAFSDAEVGSFSTLTLAHVGDGIYELMMRSALCQSGVTSASQLHRETVRRVNASAQNKAMNHLLPALMPDEVAVYKRGRNAKVNGIPQHSNVAEYHSATGLEALFGWLWMQGKTDRLIELFNIALEVL